MSTRWGGLLTLALASCVGFVPALAAEESASGWTASAEGVDRASRSKPDANFVAVKVPKYSLPDPLTALDGSRVTQETWPTRREEILDLFRQHVYSRTPIYVARARLRSM